MPSAGAGVEPHGGMGARLAFQQTPAHVPPTRPGDRHPMQVHPGFDVPGLDEAERFVVDLGGASGVRAPRPERVPGVHHPFRLVRALGRVSSVSQRPVAAAIRARGSAAPARTPSPSIVIAWA